MRIKLLGLLILIASGLTATVSAQAPGDFAPRNSLVYVRAGDVSGALDALGGDGWKERVLELLRFAGAEDMGGIDEAKRFIDYLGVTELIIADLMVRDPHVQLIEVTRLKEGAPTRFSQEFIEGAVRHPDYQITPTSVRNGPMLIRIERGLFITTVGESAEAHVRDVLAGDTEESLSGVKRFQDWNKNARGDIVAWADMRAWRTMLERLGDEVPRDVREAMEFVEWQKWDALSLSVALPGRTSGLQIQATLSLNEPLTRAAAFLKPSGASRLVPMLPAETLMLVSAQLGTSHEQTLHNILEVFHDAQMLTMPQQLSSRVDSFEMQIQWNRERRARTAANENLSEEQRAKQLEVEDSRLQQLERMLQQARHDLLAFKSRPFASHGHERESTRTMAEEFDDEIEEALTKFLGITRQEACNVLGREAVFGVLNLPDGGDRWDSEVLEHGWFVLAETEPGFDEVKEKILDRLLGRDLPPGDPADEDAQRRQRMASELLHYKVPGGEIMCERRVRSEVVFFAGSGVVGVARSDYVARRLLEAASGGGRISAGRFPAGIAGSKVGWLDLAALLDRLLKSAEHDARRWERIPQPMFDLRELLPQGAIVSARTDESAAAVTLTVSLHGPRDLKPLLGVVRNELVVDAAYSHDQQTIRMLRQSLNQWHRQNKSALDELDATEYREFVAAVTPAALIEQQLLAPRDGLYSAFDPALAQRFEKALEEGSDLVPGGENLDASGYEWYGLRRDKWPPQEEDANEGGRGIVRLSAVPSGEGWIVTATREPWLRGGRLVLLETDAGNFVHGWMPEDEFQLLRAANARGETAVKPEQRPEPVLPEWKARVELANQEYPLNLLHRQLEQRRRAAAAQGQEWRPAFNQGTPEELAQLLGKEEAYEHPEKLTIETTDDGIRVRHSEGNLWIETGPNGSRASWQAG